MSVHLQVHSVASATPETEEAEVPSPARLGALSGASTMFNSTIAFRCSPRIYHESVFYCCLLRLLRCRLIPQDLILTDCRRRLQLGDGKCEVLSPRLDSVDPGPWQPPAPRVRREDARNIGFLRRLLACSNIEDRLLYVAEHT